MDYAGSYSVANPTRDTYDRYLDSLAVFVRWLLDHDYDVKLVLGDAYVWAVDDLRAVLRKRLVPNTAERVTYRPTNSVEELLSEISATDLMVATAFHNVLLSLLLTKPVIAISFHHKCWSLMREMGLSEYCHDINDMNADTLVEQFQALAGNADDVKQRILQRVETFQRALDEQYELLFGDLVDEPRVPDVATAAT
jgi:polysaccharide pyruvyl transferase WcaK-like protein